MIREPDFTVTLHWPTGGSVNNLYASAGSKRILIKPAREYKRSIRKTIAAELMLQTGSGRRWEDDVAVLYEVYPPDRRRRDLTNIPKLIEDAMTGVVWEDDSQVADTRVVRRSIEEAGRIVLHLWRYDALPALPSETP